MIDYGLIMRGILTTAYATALVSSIVVRYRLSGSIVARSFSTMAVASAIGLTAVVIEVMVEDLRLLGGWHLPAPLGHITPVLSVHVPLMMIALSLASLARTYSRFAR